MLRVLQYMAQGVNADIRELVVQRESYQASHESGDNRIKLNELIDLYEINEADAMPLPPSILIVWLSLPRNEVGPIKPIS